MDMDSAKQPRNPQVETGRADDIELTPAGPIERQDWGTPVGPQVSGDGVWLNPNDPPATPGEDGQYRLWD